MFLWSQLQLPGNIFFSAFSSSLHPRCADVYCISVKEALPGPDGFRMQFVFVSTVQRCAAGVSVLALLRPFPAIGLSRSSQSVTPSQAQICLGFWKRPADRAMIPQASL